jgi:hypothetical protein
MKNAADVTGGKSIVIRLQSFSGVSLHLLRHSWKKETGAILMFCLCFFIFTTVFIFSQIRLGHDHLKVQKTLNFQI